MAISDLPANLRLLCSYDSSISETCRRLRMSRQTFHRYLAGSTAPSLHNLRRICDHFGVEENEILQDHASFQQLVALRRPSARPTDPLGDYVRQLRDINPRSTGDLQPYLGFYHSYFRPVEFPGKAMRSLVKVFERDGFVYNKTVENYSNIRRRKRSVLRYQGIVFHSGERIFVFERESSVGMMMWQTILYPALSDQFNVLAGLTVGVSGGARRDVACYRAVWEYLGVSPPLRSALLDCGLFDIDGAEIPEDIRSRIVNDVRADEETFVSRFWEERL